MVSFCFCQKVIYSHVGVFYSTSHSEHGGTAKEEEYAVLSKCTLTAVPLRLRER